MFGSPGGMMPCHIPRRLEIADFWSLTGGVSREYHGHMSDKPEESTHAIDASEESAVTGPQQAKEVKRREPSHYQTAMWIADQLGEYEQGTRKHLICIVKALGRTQARALLTETWSIEEQGGMMVPDGSRRRTPGGIYLHLVYTKGVPKPGRVLNRYPPGKRRWKSRTKRRSKAPKKSEGEGSSPRLTYSSICPLAAALSTVKTSDCPMGAATR